MATIDKLPRTAAFAEQHPRVRRLVEGVLDGAGVTAPALRQAAALGGEVPPDLREYLEKVVRNAYRITDQEIAAIKAGGQSEDAILELTVAAALGAALSRLERGLAASKGV